MCGQPVEEAVPSVEESPAPKGPGHTPPTNPPRSPERRYKALRTIGGIYGVLAAIALVIGGVAAIPAVLLWLSNLPSAADRQGGPLGDVGSLLALIGSLAPLLVGLTIYLLLKAGSEGIVVAIDIEENTRAIRERLAESEHGAASNVSDSSADMKGAT